MVDFPGGTEEVAQCPSYAAALGYAGVAAAVCLSNWGSAVCFLFCFLLFCVKPCWGEKTPSRKIQKMMMMMMEKKVFSLLFCVWYLSIRVCFPPQLFLVLFYGYYWCVVVFLLFWFFGWLQCMLCCFPKLTGRSCVPPLFDCWCFSFPKNFCSPFPINQYIYIYIYIHYFR